MNVVISTIESRPLGLLYFCSGWLHDIDRGTAFMGNCSGSLAKNEKTADFIAIDLSGSRQYGVPKAMNLVTVPLLYVAAVLQVSKLVPTHLQATGQAIFTAVFAGVSEVLGSIVGGWGMERLEPGWIYLGGGVLAAIGTLLTLLNLKHSEPPKRLKIKGGMEMKRKLLVVGMMFLVLVVICGCQSNNQSNAKSTNAIELEAFYPGDMTQVDSIEMMSGSNGNRKTITNPTKIREWIEKVRHLKMIPDPDQEESTGVLFHVSLFEKGRKTLNLTPTTVDHKPVRPSSDLSELMKELYENGE